MKDAWIMNCRLENGAVMVCFQEIRGNTESSSTAFFKDEHEALLAISLFKHKDIFKEMANV